MTYNVTSLKTTLWYTALHISLLYLLTISSMHSTIVGNCNNISNQHTIVHFFLSFQQIDLPRYDIMHYPLSVLVTIQPVSACWGFWQGSLETSLQDYLAFRDMVVLWVYALKTQENPLTVSACRILFAHDVPEVIVKTRKYIGCSNHDDTNSYNTMKAVHVKHSPQLHCCKTFTHPKLKLKY